MITRDTTLGELMDMTRVLEKEHGELNGVILHRSGTGRCYYQWRNFGFEIASAPAPEIPSHGSALIDHEKRKRLTDLAAGDWFEVETELERNRWLSMAKHIGVKVVSRKQQAGGWRIWRAA